MNNLSITLKAALGFGCLVALALVAYSVLGPQSSNALEPSDSEGRVHVGGDGAELEGLEGGDPGAGHQREQFSNGDAVRIQLDCFPLKPVEYSLLDDEAEVLATRLLGKDESFIDVGAAARVAIGGEGWKSAEFDSAVSGIQAVPIGSVAIKVETDPSELEVPLFQLEVIGRARSGAGFEIFPYRQFECSESEFSIGGFAEHAQEYRVTLRANGFVPSMTEWLPVPTRVGVGGPVMRLVATEVGAIRVTGQVVDSHGIPVASGQVKLVHMGLGVFGPQVLHENEIASPEYGPDGEGRFAQAWLGANGEFDLEVWQPGEYSIWAWSKGHPPTSIVIGHLQSGANEQEIVVRLPEPSELELEVRFPVPEDGGSELPLTEVQYRGVVEARFELVPGDDPGVVIARSGALPSGPAEVWLHGGLLEGRGGHGVLLEQLEVDLAEGETRRITIDFSEKSGGESISVITKGPEGWPRLAWLVALIDPETLEPWRMLPAGDDGAVTFSGVPPRDWIVAAQGVAEEGRYQAVAVHPLQAESEEWQWPIELSAETGLVELSSTSAADPSVVFLVMELEDPLLQKVVGVGGMLGRARFDRVLHFAGLPAGTYWVMRGKEKSPPFQMNGNESAVRRVAVTLGE